MSEIRVLHLVSGLNVGGIERWLLSMVPLMKDMQIKFDFYSRLPQETELDNEFINQDCKIYYNDNSRNNLFGYTNKLRKIIKFGDYHIVHNHLTLHGGLPQWLLRNLDITCIGSFHNSDIGEAKFTHGLVGYLIRIYVRNNIKVILKKSSKITCCSSDVYDYLKDNFNQHRNNEIIHYGVSTSKLENLKFENEFRREYQLNIETKIIIHVGSFTDQKNHTGLIEILKLLESKPLNYVVLLVGVGPLYDSVYKMVIKYGLLHRVKFLGLRLDVERLLILSDLFLFPSFYEGLPVACLESMAAGLPVVAYDVPGVRELIDNGVNGFLSELNDVNSMAQSVSSLLNHEDRRYKMGLHSRKIISERFSSEISAKKLHHLYHETLI